MLCTRQLEERVCVFLAKVVYQIFFGILKRVVFFIFDSSRVATDIDIVA